MSLLIKGVEVSPDHIQGITVFPEGFAIVEEYDMLLPIKTTKCEVAPVHTPHGRLIDADAFLATIRPSSVRDEFQACTLSTIKRLLVEHIEAAPTVIEAEE